jgi:hypothetical protein
MTVLLIDYLSSIRTMLNSIYVIEYQQIVTIL